MDRVRTMSGSGTAGWLIASGLASALAVITKGPYGLLVPLLERNVERKGPWMLAHLDK
jgi:hypothetical protein